MRTALVCALVALIASATSGRADEACDKPLKLITSLPMTTNGKGQVTIPIGFNGVQKQFVLDTGGAFTQISAALADDLKLRQVPSPVEFYSATGNVSKYFVRVENFTLGTLRSNSLQMVVSALPFDGVFVPLGFKGYDFDMDFAGSKLNVISSDHCEGKVLYWKAQAVAIIPARIEDVHISVPVTVDGHSFKAVVDTGASTSTMTLEVAQRVFGLQPDSDALKLAGHLNGDEKAPYYSHSFKSLTFDGVSVQNPQIAVVTDISNKNADHRNQTGSTVRKYSDDITLPPVIVGMDILRRLHVYLASKEERLYITEATLPAPDSAAK